MDWTILTLIGAFLLIIADSLFGWNIPWLMRRLGLKRASDWLEGGRTSSPNKPL